LRRILFALAGHLGRTVSELEEELSSAELTEWIALLSIEPWGPYRDDYLSSVTAWASLSPWSKEIKLADLIPKWGQQEQELPIEQQIEFMKCLGGKVQNGKLLDR